MRNRVIAVLFAASTVLWGCASSAPPLPVSAYQRDAGPFTLGLGDRLRINVFNEPRLSGEFSVTGKGTIAMPLVGDVPATGLTADQLQAELVQRLSQGYVANPDVAVEVYGFRPYFVMGEVEKPGRYPSQEGTTLMAAIATAGGFTYRANKSHVFIRREGEGSEYEVDAGQPLYVWPGDVIRVGERYF